MPIKKRPHIASFDEVKITREGESAIIEYADPDVALTHFGIGPELEHMTDAQVLETFNDSIAARDEMRRQYEHVAVEIPPGKPQIRYFEAANQWTPRGGVLRCLVEDGGPDNQATIHIDDKELSLSEFGRLLCTYAGWGMRIAFVPDDELHDPPRIEIREPKNRK